MFIEIEPMEKKVQNINGEDQYKDVINLLKELPKIKAPDNFELSVMTRIHNQNFDIERDKSNEFTVWGFLKPAAVVTLTAVIVFFVIDLSTIDVQNPLLTKPEPMDVSFSDEEESFSLQKEFIVEESVEPERKKKDEAHSAAAEMPSPQNQAYKVVINENDVISKEPLDLNFDNKSVDVDSHLGRVAAPSSRSDLLSVGAGERQRPVFDGFHTRSIENEWLRDSLAKITDSLRNYNKNLRKK
jgi:hypothetical protein